MATQAETRVVYAAGAAQGIVLVTFPAASTIFTSSSEYGLSNTQYGVLFLPQVAAAITASLLGGWLARRFGTKRVYLAGLASGLVSMLLLDREHVLREQHECGVPALAGGDGVSGGRVWACGSCAEHVDGGVSSRRGRLFGARAQRAARRWYRARAGAGRDLRWARVLVGPARALGDPAHGADRGQLRAPVARRNRRGAGGRQGAVRDPGPILGVRRLRRALRDLRDRQWQLVAARHDPRARRLNDCRRDRVDRILGDGHGRADRRRRGRTLVSDPAGVPRAAAGPRRQPS